jgi:hypothetical protein
MNIHKDFKKVFEIALYRGRRHGRLRLLSSLFSGCIMSHKWWQVGTVYQVYLRSFQDSNGDGIG